MPNMSRPRLRNGAPLDISPSLSGHSSELLSVSQTNINRRHMTAGQHSRLSEPPRGHFTESTEARMSESHHTAAHHTHTTLEESYLGSRQSPVVQRRAYHTAQEQDNMSPESDIRPLPASVTRSGRRELPVRSTRQSKRLLVPPRDEHVDLTELTMKEYRQLEKQLEYAGNAGPHKELSRLSLFGTIVWSSWYVISYPVRWVLSAGSNTNIGAWFCRLCLRIGGWLHHIVARVVLLDVWMLSRVGERRPGTCCCLLPFLLLLLLLPFLLYPGTRYIFAPIMSEETIGAATAGASSEKVVVATEADQTIGLRELIEHELLLAKEDLKKHDTVLYKDNLAQINKLENQLEGLRAEISRLEGLKADSVDVAGLKTEISQLEGLKADMFKLQTVKADASQLEALKADVTLLEGLRADITQLEAAHQALVARLRDCCKNDTVLAGLVSKGIHEQLAAIMLGGSGSDVPEVIATSGDGSSTDSPASGTSADMISSSAFAVWLNSQFAKPGDFDAKIAALTEQLNKSLREQAEATQQAAVLAAQAEKTATDASVAALKASELSVALQKVQDGQTGAWTQDKDSLSALLAARVEDLKARDTELSSDVAAAAALAAAAANTANEAKKLAEDIKERDDVVAGVGARVSGQERDTAGIGIDVGAGCGCDSKTVLIPDTYQPITEEQVKLLIREALGIFGADKTGMVDYALESAGGSVISTRCSETYHRRTAQLSLFGIPLWYTSNSPRTVIQPEVHPGQCWAFRGTHGYIVIQLAGFVRPTAFSMEHIPKVLSPSGQIDSAPKDFSVWGLKHERDVEGTLFGNYTYLDNNETLQFFPVTDSSVDAFHIVELRIHSNHGNQEYTCLYRFRVHGVLKMT